MYKVPLEIPEYCNKCPFGRCSYSLPLPKEQGYKEFSSIDGKECESGTYGYVCNIQFGILGSYEDVISIFILFPLICSSLASLYPRLCLLL